MSDRHLTRIRRERSGPGPEDRVFYIAEYSDGAELFPLTLDDLAEVIEGKVPMRVPLDAFTGDYKQWYGSKGR